MGTYNATTEELTIPDTKYDPTTEDITIPGAKYDTTTEEFTIEESIQVSVLKQLLGITDDAEDGLLELCLAMAEMDILNYCHIDTLPDALIYVKVRMAADMYTEKYSASAMERRGVSSIKEGDTQVSFASGTDSISETGTLIKYIKYLNRFRRLF